MRIIVSGLLAQYPLGGAAWDYVQFPAGLLRLGHDVHYVEDTGQWPYNPEEQGISASCDYNVRYLRRVMDRFGLQGRWAYCFPWKRQWFGKTESEVQKLVRSADLVINVSASLRRPERYRGPGRLVLLDSDPVFTQLKLASGQRNLEKLVDAHDLTFSFGETLPGAAPVTGHDWQPTRQPVLLDEWDHDLSGRRVMTTVMNWTSYKPITYDGVEYGHKNVEFKRFMDLPGKVGVPLELAINAGKTKRTPREFLAHRGWLVANPDEVCPDLDSYREYLQTSYGEWSVAKNGYVRGQAGWFSCRSACYLAAGRPVVVQETGFSSVLPTGAGLFTFRDEDELLAAMDELLGSYNRHRAAARDLAHEYFDSAKVLSSLIERATG